MIASGRMHGVRGWLAGVTLLLGIPAALTLWNPRDEAPTSQSTVQSKEILESSDALRILARAEGLIRLGLWDAAAEHLSAAHAVSDPFLLQSHQRLNAWRLYLSEQPHQLIHALNDLPRTPELEFLWQSARLRLAKPGALPALQQTWWTQAHTVWGLLALREVVQHAEHYRENDRAIVAEIVPTPSVDLRTLASEARIALLQRLVEASQPNGALWSEAHAALGLAHLKAERFTESVKALTTGARRTKNKRHHPWLKYHLAQALRHRGDLDRAWDLFTFLSSNAPTPLSTWALADAGELALVRQRYDEARQLFESALLAHPAGPQRATALWGLGWIALRQGDYRRAERFLHTLESEQPYGPMAARALYWRARALVERGDPEAGHQAFRNLLQRFPVDYYAYRAKQALPSDGVRTVPALAAPPTSDARTDAALERINTLIATGLHRKAHTHFNAQWKHRKHMGPASLTVLAAVAQQLDAPQRRAEARALRAQRYPRDPQEWQQHGARFSSPYLPLLVSHARRERTPLPILAALVRQESRFNPRAVSPAGAAGLMQLMPKTAELLRRENDLKARIDSEDLFEPEVNVALGSRYLGRMIRAFQRRLEYALAAYNAGPGAVTRWRASRGDLPADIFVEEIPYRETRHYVRNVLAGAHVFEMAERKGNPKEAHLAQK